MYDPFVDRGPQPKANAVPVMPATDDLGYLRSLVKPKLAAVTFSNTNLADIIATPGASKYLVICALQVQNGAVTENTLSLFTGLSAATVPKIILGDKKGSGLVRDLVRPWRLLVNTAFQGQLAVTGTCEICVDYWIENAQGVPDSAFTE